MKTVPRVENALCACALLRAWRLGANWAGGAGRGGALEGLVEADAEHMRPLEAAWARPSTQS